MDLYIERQKAIDACFDGWDNTAHECAENIRSIPAADVQQVVLCRDCKHWDIDWLPNYAKENEHFCLMVALTTRGDWFCADGERRA